MKQALKQSTLIIAGIVTFAACKKDSDPTIIIPPSNGSKMTINESAPDNEIGSSAKNSVFIDFSTDKQSAVKRDSWDLAFYSGNDFRVKINNTALALAKVVNKADINAVNVSDTVGAKLIWDQSNPQLVSLGLTDAVNGDLTKTVIPAISSNDADNKVIIINRGTNGGITARDFMKVKILRKGDGYTLQYAKLNATNFSTIDVAKDANYNFKYVSFDNGAVTVEPTKKDWDIMWTYSGYEYLWGSSLVEYGASDYILINYLNNTQATEIVYANESVASDAFTKFNKDSVSKYPSFAKTYNAIGDKWRVTSKTSNEPDPVGIRKYRFYIIKDGAGNSYKLRFLAAGIGGDGGTRGKPQIEYTLIK